MYITSKVRKGIAYYYLMESFRDEAGQVQKEVAFTLGSYPYPDRRQPKREALKRLQQLASSGHITESEYWRYRFYILEREWDSDHWQTPDFVLSAVRAVLGGAIELDPCTHPENPTKARSFYTALQNGLSQPWKGKCFMNPPYSGRLALEFAEKLWDEYEQGHIPEAIALVKAGQINNQGTGAIYNRGTILQWKGRLNFVLRRPPRAYREAPTKMNGSNFDVAIVYFGEHPERFKAAFAEYCW